VTTLPAKQQTGKAVRSLPPMVATSGKPDKPSKEDSAGGVQIAQAPPIAPAPAPSSSEPTVVAPDPTPAATGAMSSKPVEGMKSGDNGRLVLTRRAVSARLPDPVDLPSEQRRSAAAASTAAYAPAVGEVGQGGGGRYTLLSDQDGPR
jgi:hypothetical protein